MRKSISIIIVIAFGFMAIHVHPSWGYVGLAVFMLVNGNHVLYVLGHLGSGDMNDDEEVDVSNLPFYHKFYLRIDEGGEAPETLIPIKGFRGNWADPREILIELDGKMWVVDTRDITEKVRLVPEVDPKEYHVIFHYVGNEDDFLAEAESWIESKQRFKRLIEKS